MSATTATVTPVPQAIGQWSDLINGSAYQSGVPASIIAAVINQESGGNPDEVGTQGEIGLGQFMPQTAASLGINPSNNTQNVYGIGTYLAQLYQQFGSWAAALSAYNSGSPTGSPAYASSVLSQASQWGFTGQGLAPTTATSSTAPASGTPSTGTTPATTTPATGAPASGASFYIIAVILVVFLLAAGMWGLVKG